MDTERLVSGQWIVLFNECDFAPSDVTYQPLESDSGTSEVNVPPTGTIDVLPLVEENTAKIAVLN
jgi:hypothetical protein